MKQIIVNLTEKYRVVIDDLNHTLQEFHPISKTRKNEQWLPVAYYSTLGGAMNRVAKFYAVDAGEYNAIEYANAVMQKAEDLIKETNK